MIRQLAVVPTTPLALPHLPGRRHAEIAVIAAAAGRVCGGLSTVDAIVLLAGGRTFGVHNPPPTDLAGYGLRLPDHPLSPVPAPVRDRVDVAVGAVINPSPASDRGVRGPAPAPGSDPDLAVLARWAPAGARCVGVTVPADAGVDATASLADAIIDIAADRPVAVLVAGDLGAGHGTKPPRPDGAGASTTLDGDVVAALDNGRPADLTRLDADLVAASGCRAAGALRVLGQLLDLARLGTVVRATAAPLGVGYVVAQGG